ncbi:RidA family protein [Pseudochrobactrum asaccharolyticum]|jgi:enamine deaminase RidA (YjgF/YER057c/UK114 family)|uniref:Enamine deaminase RidA (YjgF/YER057c/UK114 family) n=1 Tax=Pseudochrobactrum asaccharolyticum TaxID=354351 RepID=A0A366EC73_9HYPH|nr:RidA family protein [Pseudochrobactrum asaccharolyticum]MBX8801322.1 RidA family protein [Ochrobactrum sp. MR28]MBX8817332.1 RidA family protein [Ochrobactrum sp. MR31]MDR2312336.1 RidA family protein [Brucellaceae bacterium]RBO99064.1 enamine deaminase RidA (YjgF/YER057c/UK114 family) [Pseudochrobactrum asaccharolyticum]
MTSTIETRLKDLGITIPESAAPAAAYLPFSQSGNLLFTSGQLPLKDGKLVSTGLVGRDLTIEQAQEAAKYCAINVLSQAQAALGDLKRIKRVIKITVFVASVVDFTDQHVVANGGSQLFIDVLGDAGKHARSAVGMAGLPLNAPVEIEAILEVE